MELTVGVSTVPLGCRTIDDGVYKTDVVVAFEPAELDPDAEKELEAAAPVAPVEAFDWIYRSLNLCGSSCHCGSVSRIT